jgi:glycosyltransferase involved in cell wall biosynthesis
MTKRILHLHFGLEGGAERFMVNLTTAFAQRGIEQRFVIRPGRVWAPEVKALGPVIESNYRKLSLRRFWLDWKVRQMDRQWQPDVIMGWMSRASALIPTHSNALRVTRLGDYQRSLENYHSTDVIVPNTPGIAENCRALGWDKPIQVISNFAREVTPRPIARSEMNTPEDAFVIVGTGRFHPRKGFETLIQAAAQIPGAYLWLLGDGEERARLETMVDTLGLRARARFTGWMAEPIHHVAAGDVYVMPSRHEPLGNVVLEAWLAQTPVVCTRSEGPSWFAENGQNALMVDIGDAPAMAAAIARLRDDRALAAHLVQNGATKLQAQFSKGAIVDQYLTLFEQGR